jgi:hypothetical protein
MTVTPQVIRSSYDALLGRAPSKDELEELTVQHATVPSLRRAIFNSDEFTRRYRDMRRRAEADRPPLLIHLHIPRTGGTSLTERLTDQEALQPARDMRMGEIQEYLKAPRAERLALRYLHGRLDMGVGETLDVPHRYLCTIRRPGPRIHSVWSFVRRTPSHPAHDIVAEREMSFGDFLDYSTETRALRLELDNGQIRRLAGQSGPGGLGQERALLARALHGATSPLMILGTTERLGAVAEALVEAGYLADATLPRSEASPPDEVYDRAVADLTPSQADILSAYSAWDAYLYEVCAMLTESGKEALRT